VTRSNLRSGGPDGKAASHVVTMTLKILAAGPSGRGFNWPLAQPARTTLHRGSMGAAWPSHCDVAVPDDDTPPSLDGLPRSTNLETVEGHWRCYRKFWSPPARTDISYLEMDKLATYRALARVGNVLLTNLTLRAMNRPTRGADKLLGSRCVC